MNKFDKIDITKKKGIRRTEYGCIPSVRTRRKANPIDGEIAAGGFSILGGQTKLDSITGSGFAEEEKGSCCKEPIRGMEC